MKRIFIMLLCAACMTSCLWTHYFEPEVVGTSDSEAEISCLGDTCWFQVNFSRVMTRFQPGEDFKPFRYVVEVEELEADEPIVVEHDRDLAELMDRLEEEFPEFYEKYRGLPQYYSSGIIAFAVPANLAQEERKVEVKVSIAKDYHDTENWGEWETVFSAIQEGFNVEESESGHMILDGYKVMFGEYEVSSVICFEEMMPEHLIEPATENIQAGRKLQDGARVFLNHDMTYSIVESDKTVSSGTYKIGIYENDTCEDMCYYYRGSSKGYLDFNDNNGDRLLFGMFIAANENSSVDYGTLWPYQGFEIKEGDSCYSYGIRYGLTYCE